MSNNFESYCFIDTKNQSNKCEDNNYSIVYDNKGTDVFKVNYNNFPSLTNKNSDPRSYQIANVNNQVGASLTNNTQAYAQAGHEKGNNTTYTSK